MGKIIVNAKEYIRIGGILGEIEGSNVEINNAYNTGKIEMVNLSATDQYVGSIVGDSTSIVFNNCYYLTNTYDVGVGSGDYTGIQELNSIDRFPSVLEVVNGEGAFEEDSSNVNGGYPVLKMD